MMNESVTIKYYCANQLFMFYFIYFLPKIRLQLVKHTDEMLSFVMYDTKLTN